MIILREIQEKDIDALERFAQIPGFINLQNDRDALIDKIKRSQKAFSSEISNKDDGKYLFIAEDTESGKVLGTSMIASQHGTVESPHFYFQVGSEERYSNSISTGFIHGTLELVHDTNGPSEIGGLVLDPDHRNTPERVGRQISFVRFLFLGLHKNLFRKKLLAELLPPLNKKGQSPLWEAIGRRFTNMDYWEADQLCQKDKGFIFSLFPSGKVYTTFLSAEARNAIGKVGKETEPVVHMLNKIGFKYKNQVDPFDGGPHLWADVEDLLPVKNIAHAKYQRPLSETARLDFQGGLLCKARQAPGTFRAVSVSAVISQGRLELAEKAVEIEKLLSLSPGDEVEFMPYY